MRPRILILSTAYLPLIGGSELAIQNMTDRLPGFDFDMVTGRYASDMPAQERIGRINVFRVNYWFEHRNFFLPKIFMPLAIAFKAFQLMLKHNYSVIHAYQASQAAGAIVLLRIFYPHIPVLLTIQEGKELEQQPLLVRIGRKLIFLAADRITVISNYLADYVRVRVKIPIDIIPNGVDIQKFVNFQLPATNYSTTKTIISVSRLVPKNGLDNLIRAMPWVWKRFPDARLILIGDGPLKDELKTISYKLQVFVEFVGSVPPDKLPDYLHSADVFVRPSLSEGLGTAFLEAMAAKVPVVASRVGGIVDFLEHERTGLVCDPKNPKDIADQIIRFLEDSELKEKIVEQSWRMVRDRYSWDKVAHSIGEIYNKMART